LYSAKEYKLHLPLSQKKGQKALLITSLHNMTIFVRFLISLALSLTVAYRGVFILTISPFIHACAGYKKRSLSTSGAIAGCLVGFVTCLCGGYRAALTLIAFFISSSFFTKYSSHRKKALEDEFKEGGHSHNHAIDDTHAHLRLTKHAVARCQYNHSDTTRHNGWISGGQRNWVQVLCNGGAATLLVALLPWVNSHRLQFLDEGYIDLQHDYHRSVLMLMFLGYIELFLAMVTLNYNL
jgi:uncharacterized membrane protein